MHRRRYLTGRRGLRGRGEGLRSDLPAECAGWRALVTHPPVAPITMIFQVEQPRECRFGGAGCAGTFGHGALRLGSRSRSGYILPRGSRGIADAEATDVAIADKRRAELASSDNGPETDKVYQAGL